MQTLRRKSSLLLLTDVNVVREHLIQYLSKRTGSTIRKMEFKEIVEKSGIDHLHSCPEKLFELIDRNNDGEIEVEELITTICEAAKLTINTEDEGLIFHLFDSDSSNTLNKREFGLLLQATLNAKLMTLIEDSTGIKYLEEHMKMEENIENL
uniref:EF-hand domain-containing protein n=1 Tax=Lotharella globosa TaxID=91324 RepID=A0A7S3ZA60_9EUKA|mmetsp:Transcript_4756/g.9250  ORF Transcript_4756/g.9250 Transcript_4756/m.9250 type:complete len:152 (+) Transcript_4756:198-653(+)